MKILKRRNENNLLEKIIVSHDGKEWTFFMILKSDWDFNHVQHYIQKKENINHEEYRKIFCRLNKIFPFNIIFY